jgi:hypothetical protein
VNLITNRNFRGFQFANCGRDPAIGQIVARVTVKSDNQNPGMMASGSHDQIVQLFEIVGTPSQDWQGLTDGETKYARIGEGQQANVTGQDRIEPLST